MTETALTTNSTKFVNAVNKQFVAEMGTELSFSDYEKTLAQHMFLKIDAQLKALEAKRNDSNKPTITWSNINMQKLALDAVHRVSLGLDALIPNHIHPIPYLNNKTGLYDVDLRIGYLGKIYSRQKLAVEEPTEVILNLVHKNDVFKPMMKSHGRDVESYEFEIPNPFDRGDVVGGFGYIVFKDPKKNKLIIVTKRDFDKAKSAAKTGDFWGKDKFEMEMQFKTLVHRVADKLQLDPKKVNAKSYAYVEAQEAEEDAEREQERNANKDYIDVEHTVDDSQDYDDTPAEEPAPKVDLEPEKPKAEKKQAVKQPQFEIAEEDVPY